MHDQFFKMFFVTLLLNRQSFFVRIAAHPPQWVGSENWQHSPESDLVKHQSTCKSPWKRKKMSLTLCQAVGRRLVWRLYELSSHSSERSTSQPQTSLHSVFFPSFDLFSYTWRWNFPCKTGTLPGSPPGVPQPRGTPRFGSGVLSPCSQRAGGPEAGASFPAEELNPAAGPPGAEAKGPGSCPRLKAKMSQGGKGCRNKVH